MKHIIRPRHAPHLLCAVLLMAGLATCPPQPACAEKKPTAGRDMPGGRKSPASLRWAVPLDGGPVNTLFIAPRYTMLDALDFAGLIELRYEFVPVWDADNLGANDENIPGANAEDTLTNLHRQLTRKWDVIVLGNFDFNILPEDVRAQLNQLVRNGAGLIVVNQRGTPPKEIDDILNNIQPDDAADAVSRGIGHELTPEWPISLDFVKAGRYGKGRVVHLDYPGDRPKSSFLLPALNDPIHARECYRDTYYSLVAKAVRYAAGRDPAVGIESITDITIQGPSDKEIPPGWPEEYIQRIRDEFAKPLYHTFRITFRAPTDQTYRIQAQVREPSRGLTLIYPALPQVPQKAVEYLLELPTGPGTYLLDIRLATRKNRTVEWHSQVVRINAWPEIKNLTCSKGLLMPNDTLDISLDIRPQYHRPRPCTVFARATDSLGRIVAEAGVRAPEVGGTVKLTLLFADLIANLVKVEVFAADSVSPQPSRWQLEQATYATPVYLPVRAPRPVNRPGFAAISPAPTEYNIRRLHKILAGLGIDSLIVPPVDESRFYLAVENLRPIPVLLDNAPQKIEANVRTPCLATLPYQDDILKKISETASAFSIMGVSVYCVGDGACLSSAAEEPCICPTCLTGFREWLGNRYTGIDELNRAWKSAFTQWDQVVPATRDQALESGIYPPWLEFRLYMDAVFAKSIGHTADVVQSVDRYARAGFVALPGSRASLGYDWALLASRLEAPAILPDPVVVEMIRSFKPSDGVPALLFGNEEAADPVYAQWLPWYQVLHGFGTIWCPKPFGTALMDAHLPALQPDGTPTEPFARLVHSIEQVKSGLGTLLLNARRDNPPIAIHASQASLYINQVDPAFQCDSRRAEAGFLRLFESLAYQCDFISCDQLRSGALNQYKVLVLPMVRSLGDEEIECIRRFAQAGGRLIADIAPGEFDQHGQRRFQMPLDDTFGIQHTAGPAPLVIVDVTAETPGLRIPLAGLVADADVQPAGGTPGATVDKTPLWLVNEQRALLLNHSWLPYGSADGVTPAIRNIIRDFLDLAQIPPQIAQDTSAPPFYGEICRFSYGAATLLALLADPVDAPKTQELKLNFGKNFVYDLRNPDPFPASGKLRVKLARGEFALYAVLPYKVNAIQVTCPQSVRAGNRLPFRIVIQAENHETGDHLVHVSLLKNNTPVPYYEMDAPCPNGQTATYIPLAIDEPQALYTLRVTDKLSEMSQNLPVNILTRTPSE